MEIQRSREIVIEYERIQIIRKRARTNFEFCTECRSNSDFVFLTEAAKIFIIKREILLQFIKDTGSHYQTKTGTEIYVCLNSFLAKMKERSDKSTGLHNSKAKMIGD